MTKKASDTSPGQGYILWLGDEHSFQSFLYAEEGLLQHIKSGSVKPEAGCSGCDDDEDDTPSRLLQLNEGVAIITIHGSLTNRDSWMNRYFGLVSYNEIRQALVQAFEDESVHQILLDISSGGGAVAGVSDTANLIKSINKAKPVTTFSDGTMASAAYWLGSSAGTIKISNTAVVGSIGVIMQHTEYSKMLKEAGITATMLRAGKYKALMNPYEPLTELAKDEADKQLQHIYQVFVQNVAENLGASYPDVDAKMAQGREFVGSQALEVGMVDGIASFDQIIGDLIEKSKLASTGDDNNLYMESGIMKKKALSAVAIEAAVAAGADRSQFEVLPEPDSAIASAVTLASDMAQAAKADSDASAGLAKTAADALVLASAAVVEAQKDGGTASAELLTAETGAKTAADATAAAAADAFKASGEATAAAGVAGKATDEPAATAAAGLAKTAAASAATAKGVAVAASPEAPAVPAEPKADAGGMSELRTQLEVANQKVIDLSVELSQLKTVNKIMVDSQEGLCQIARDSINKMRVALGGSVSDLSAVTGTELLASHEAASGDFIKTFKVGGVASTSVDDDREESAAAVRSEKHNAAVDAAQIG